MRTPRLDESVIREVLGASPDAASVRFIPSVRGPTQVICVSDSWKMDVTHAALAVAIRDAAMLFMQGRFKSGGKARASQRCGSLFPHSPKQSFW